MFYLAQKINLPTMNAARSKRKLFQPDFFLAAFAALSLANFTCIATQFQPGIFLTKPLLLASLAAWFYLKTKDYPTLFSQLMLAGFLLSMAGDTLLMLIKSGGEQFFLFGLGSFLVAHVCYIFAFVKYPKVRSGLVWRKPLLKVPFLIFLVFMLAFLWADLPGGMKLPVVFYCCVIVFMAINALNMSRRASVSAAKLLFFGAILFVISDAIIALHKFKFPEMPEIPTSLAIMATYLAGQFLLANGSTKANSEASSFLF